MNPGKDAWIGVLGGGQLGRMLSLAARQMGLHVLAWTGGDRSGAASTADRIIDKPFEDSDAMDEFTNSVRVATVEFETYLLKPLNKLRIEFLYALEVMQFPSANIEKEKKRFLSENGFESCANFNLAHDLDSFTEGLSKINSPVIVKTAEFGYDGKGQLRLSSTFRKRH